MSEADIERLGNRPVRKLQIPAWFAESKSKLVTAKTWLKRGPGYVAPLEDNTVRVLSQDSIRFAQNLVFGPEKYIEYSTLQEDKIVIGEFFEYPTLNAYSAHQKDSEITKSFGFPKGLLRELKIENGIYDAYRDEDLVFINFGNLLEKSWSRKTVWKKRTKEEIEQILSLRNDGFSYRQIEEKTGIPKATSHRIFQILQG